LPEKSRVKSRGVSYPLGSTRKAPLRSAPGDVGLQAVRLGFDLGDLPLHQVADGDAVVQAGRLVGIVSIGDLVKWKISEVEAEADGLKAYIAGS